MKHIRDKKIGLRAKLKRAGKVRMSVTRSSKHIYVQLVSPEGLILGAASTLSAEIKKSHPYGGNIKAAEAVGKMIAKIAKKLGLEEITFDRSGYLYHGRVKALAEAVRAEGVIN